MTKTTERKRPSQIDRARAYVSKMEPAIEGSGGDRQTFIVCCKLVEFGLSQSDASAVLSEYNQRCQPKWSEKSLQRKLKMAFARATPSKDFCDDKSDERVVWKESESETVRKWPSENTWMRKRIVSSGPELADLLEFSPLVLESKSSDALRYVSQLFPGDPLVCCGKDMMTFWTKRISEFGDSLANFQFIVPSPMSNRLGKIKDPEPGGPFESAHTFDNTGERRYAVVEFDTGAYDDHAALLWHLGDFAPLVMAVHSGGKSLHGWFSVCGDTEDEVFKFYRYAVSIGADYHTFLKSQFVRMPDGRRKCGRRQEVFYFNPEAITL